MNYIGLKLASIAWRRGLHRLFIVAAVAWSIFVLVGMPIEAAYNSREVSDASYRLCLASDDLKDKTECEERHQQDLYAASLPSIYRSDVIPQLHLWALFVVIPPAALYILVWLLIATGRWIYRGFKSDTVTK